MGYHTLTGNNLKTTTDTAMKLGMYIKLSVKYTCSNICSYFERIDLKDCKNFTFHSGKKDNLMVFIL